MKKNAKSMNANDDLMINIQIENWDVTNFAKFDDLDACNSAGKLENLDGFLLIA